MATVVTDAKIEADTSNSTKDGGMCSARGWCGNDWCSSCGQLKHQELSWHSLIYILSPTYSCQASSTSESG